MTLDIVGKVKWSAWKELGNMSKVDFSLAEYFLLFIFTHKSRCVYYRAKRRETVNKLLKDENPNWNPQQPSKENKESSLRSSSNSSSRFTRFKVTIEHNCIYKKRSSVTNLFGIERVRTCQRKIVAVERGARQSG